MTSEEKNFFYELTKIRKNIANVLEEPSVRGIKKSIVEKYSDQAHFIYELLQNSDDAQAISANFTLKENKLIFSHNGLKHFTISNPNTEEEDTESGKLGDLNSITSVANSNKTKASIGKFGVGFKAVFQYTDTPYIYDPNVCFKIGRFIVPILLNEDYPDRNKKETVFVFPFDKKEKSEKDAYEDIEKKLDTLIYPTLFLNNLKTVNYNTLENKGKYTKELLEQFKKNNIICEKIKLIKIFNEKEDEDYIWLFSQIIDEYKISVGFFVNKENKIIDKKYNSFCFFPTKENTHLNFIINAPFLLTDSREGIKLGNAHNNRMISSLSVLASNSLDLLKEISLETKTELFDDDSFLSIIPYRETDFKNEWLHISFKQFYEEIKNKLRNSEIIPCGKLAFTNCKNAYWASYSNVTEVFSNSKIELLLGNKDAKWILPSIGRAEILRTNKELSEYIDDIINKKNLSDESIIKLITKEFIENQSTDWLFKLYRFISSSSQRMKYAKNIPIFLNNERKATAAFDEAGKHILFISNNIISDYNFILPELLSDENIQILIKNYQIKQPELKDEVYNKIIPIYNTSENESELFKKIFTYYKKCPQEDHSKYINNLKNAIKFRGNLKKDVASELYFETPLLQDFFITNKVNFLDLQFYQKIVEPQDYELLDSFFKELTINTLPKNIVIDLPYSIEYKPYYNLPKPQSTSIRRYSESSFEGLDDLIRFIIKEQNKEKSESLWKMLIKLNEHYHNLKNYINGTCHYFYYSMRSMTYNSESLSLLKCSKWLLDKNDNFLSPSEIYIEDLSNRYSKDSPDFNSLINFLEIKSKPQKTELEKYKEAVKEIFSEKFSLLEKLHNAGIKEEDIPILIALKQKNNVSVNILTNKNTDNVTYTVMDIYNKWKSLSKEEWLSKKREYYKRLFPAAIINNNHQIKDLKISQDYFISYDTSHPKIPQSWCILFMLGNLQSKSYWGEVRSEIARKNKIDSLMELITEFSNGESLDVIYNKYLDSHQTKEDDLLEFESLLRVYKFRKNFMQVWAVLKGIKNEDIVELNTLINPSTAAAASGKGLNVFASQKSLKYGISMIIRELLDNGFFGDTEQEQENSFNLLNKFTYIPHAYLRRIVFNDWTEYPQEKSSEEIYDAILGTLQKENLEPKEIKAFMKCHDLPFLILGEKNDKRK